MVLLANPVFPIFVATLAGLAVVGAGAVVARNVGRDGSPPDEAGASTPAPSRLLPHPRVAAWLVGGTLSAVAWTLLMWLSSYQTRTLHGLPDATMFPLGSLLVVAVVGVAVWVDLRR